jgi:hypothetical protein
MKQEIKDIQFKVVPILKKRGVFKAGIFGSYARGEQKKKSDVDILIEIGPEASLFDIIKIKLELQRALKRRVDLVEYEVIRPELKEQILKDEVRIL